MEDGCLLKSVTDWDCALKRRVYSFNMDIWQTEPSQRQIAAAAAVVLKLDVQVEVSGVEKKESTSTVTVFCGLDLKMEGDQPKRGQFGTKD